MTKHPIISREVTGLVKPLPSRSFGRVGFLCSSIMSLALASCGGSRGDSDTSNSLIAGGVTGGSATVVETEELQEIAANLSMSGLGINLDNLQTFGDDVGTVSLPGSDTETINDNPDPNMFSELEESNNNFLNNTLGIGDTNALVTRENNLITIDPDEAAVCADEIPLSASLNDEQNRCQQLVADLLVTIDAQSDETGIITYSFQNSPFWLIGYSPNGVSYEINLGGLFLIVERSAQLEGQVLDPVPNIAGAIRLSAQVQNDEPGSEAGQLTLAVTDALNLDTGSGESTIRLQPSTVFELDFNEASGDFAARVDWGALQLFSEVGSGDSEGNTTIQASQFNLAGLSGELSANSNSPDLQLRNIGIGGVPLNITIDSVEAISLDLENFGVNLNGDTGVLSLDGALAAQLAFDNMMGIFDDISTDSIGSFSLSSAAGSVFTPRSDGSTELSDGGPLNASVSIVSNSGSTQIDTTVSAGDCFVSAGGLNIDTSAEQAGFELVPCPLDE